MTTLMEPPMIGLMEPFGKGQKGDFGPALAWRPVARESVPGFVTGCGLANELMGARDEKILSRTLKRYAGYGLLIIDELGSVPFSKESADLIFQVLTERNERKTC